jgi:hypothetical protein
VLLPSGLPGPAVSAHEAIVELGLTGEILITDVDHAVGIGPVLQSRAGNDCVVPTWSLSGEDLRHWSVVAVRDQLVSGIAEKRLPETSGNFLGAIGCTWFSSAEYFAEAQEVSSATHVSGVIAAMLRQGRRVAAVGLEDAEFYGSRDRIARVNAAHGKQLGTVFCDLDGTVVVHQDQPTAETALRLLDGAVERLADWVSVGYRVVLTTARPSEQAEALENLLRQAGVPFHDLIVGLPSGPRYLINDRKPSKILTAQAVAREVDRDVGIVDVELPDEDLRVLCRFPGGSHAETLLVEDAEKRFVRKRVRRQSGTSSAHTVLRGQYRRMARFRQMSQRLVPYLYGEKEDEYEYHYDMEYLEEHQPLHALAREEQSQAVDRLMSALDEDVYSVRRALTEPSSVWLRSHLSTKIWGKFAEFEAIPGLSAFVSGDGGVINGTPCHSLRELLHKIDAEKMMEHVSPLALSEVHGDLTFENVLWANGDVRLIDVEGSGSFEALELDLGKLLQSSRARYERWAHDGATLVSLGSNEAFFATSLSSDSVTERILDCWSQVLNRSLDSTRVVGDFYLSLHLFRMVPFRRRASDDQAQHAFLLGLKTLQGVVEALR